jgi:hypothetical protein
MQIKTVSMQSKQHAIFLFFRFEMKLRFSRIKSLSELSIVVSQRSINNYLQGIGAEFLPAARFSDRDSIFI